ncbi:toll-like receptor 2 type-1 isoform X1 [Brachyhypopomus gauderio]|uniref:toll-like receptor 2 type-1 isoform X1 n=1 Tax=Brachyhypopomus gauderio TaxID=698409 RepID=UPI0040423EDF
MGPTCVRMSSRMIHMSTISFLVLCLPGMFSQPSCSNCEEHTFCNCSKRGFSHVPQVPGSALGLDLSFNNIEVIYQGDLEVYTELRELNLHKNKLNVICAHPFKSQKHLEFLDLSDNLLTNVSSSWFENLQSLQHLNILGNNYTTLGGNPIFHTLANLRILQFGNRYLQKLEKNFLCGLYSLTEMEFNCSSLKAYENGSLHPYKPLSTFTMKNIQAVQENVAIIVSILYDVFHPATAVEISDFVLTDNTSVLPLQHLFNLGVKKFTFSNGIASDKGISNMLKIVSNNSLTYLGVENVELQGDGYWPSKVNFTHLDTIYIRNIHITSVFFFSLKLVFPIGNILKLSIIECNVFIVLCKTTTLLESLEYLDFSKNQLSDLTIQEALCFGRGIMSHLNTLNISQNYLKSIETISQLVLQFKKLAYLDLSQNNFNDMPENCEWPLNLTFLNLSSTKLYRVTPCLPHSLQILDLTDNDLATFFPFSTLPNLIELKLSGNKFIKLPEGKSFPNLEALFIQRNTLSMFTKSDLRGYMKLHSLDAGQNKFVCSCEFVTFLQYDVENFVTLTDGHHNYICDSPLTFQGQKIINVQLSIFECHMITAVSIICTGVILVLLLSGFTCYKLHILWYLRMSWAWFQAKRKSALCRNTNVIYDAFVSYSDHDSEWVEELLVPELERAESSFALCLHKRNFQPGRWILDNIIDSIEKSHYTLFVISEHFIMSDWCRYELDFAHFRIFDEKDDSVILILLEPIDKNSIPKRFCKLRKVMNSKTYLEWPTDEDMTAEFWHNLKAALRREES